MAKVYIALGANLSSPVAQLNDAVIALSQLADDKQVTVSPYYRSAPMGDVEQPDYVNAVASFRTQLNPIALLDALQAIEQQQGRVREVRWGARTLDLDILLYDQQQINLPRLTVPHYGMKQRSFVLVPLQDIAPELVLPCGTSLVSLIDENCLAEVQQLGLDH
ncbi:2-amino-4-hydroxy-6-hydroxymethyldihydropteridine diphosphokinase [Shewanella sp. Isolate11]|uniref:2-amino-4-hydroxy-6- hydroxymethyldihydropteridine diphosphokinase n=1 Tax=Shewanella sp. Isolate11 TaxID=2908530 RepID=UPI001EFED37B|nr:2-amino-4-hydroxy-6-hydroxymethyldihydropteridine diphosphokinase [Shewanella sp. Isolate11]MCG9695684.1 2-amino-4-hydroxy-6-hydroxymethyldihydropteridine diphosphokinase [Shewanella sp. Isolate11]